MPSERISIRVLDLSDNPFKVEDDFGSLFLSDSPRPPRTSAHSTSDIVYSSQPRADTQLRTPITTSTSRLQTPPSSASNMNPKTPSSAVIASAIHSMSSSTLNAKIATVKTAVFNAIEEVMKAGVLTVLKSNETEISQLEEKVKDLQYDLRQAKESREKFRQSYDEASKKNKAQQEDLRKSNMDRDNLQLKYNDLYKKFAIFDRERSELVAEMDNLAEERDEKLRELADQNRELEEASKTIKTLQSQRDSRKRKWDAFMKEMEGTNDESTDDEVPIPKKALRPSANIPSSQAQRPRAAADEVPEAVDMDEEPISKRTRGTASGTSTIQPGACLVDKNSGVEYTMVPAHLRRVTRLSGVKIKRPVKLEDSSVKE